MKFTKGNFQAGKVIENDWSWKVVKQSQNFTSRSWNFTIQNYNN